MRRSPSLSLSLSESLRTAVRALRDRPSDLLPFYVLGAAVPTVARVGTFFGLAIVYLHLETAGRLETVRERLAAVDGSPPDAEAQPEAFAEWVDAELAPVFEPIVTPATFAVLAITALLTIAIAVVLVAALAGGQLAACHGRLRDGRGLRAGIEGVRRYWLSVLGVFVLEVIAWIALTVGVAIVAGIAGAVASAAVDPLVGALVGFAFAVVWLVSVLAVRAVFAFAPVAIVVDGASALDSVSNAAGFVRSRPVEAGFYYLLSILSFVLLGVLFGALSALHVDTLVPLVGFLLLFPLLDLLKTTLYGAYRDSVAPMPAPDRSLADQLSSGLSRGWRELVAFVRETPALHAGVLATGLVGFWMGWVGAAPYGGFVETSIAARLEDHVPPAAASEFFANNWTVALTTAYAGAFLALPALASIWFNGLVLGIYARLEVAPMELLAFVVPHGIFEIPAILIAGALGVHLGLVGWRTVRGRRERAVLAGELERAFWVLVGLGVLLAVAALIEGFVSPYYLRFLP